MVGLLARTRATHLLQAHVQGVVPDFSGVAAYVQLDGQHMVRLKPCCCCVHHCLACKQAQRCMLQVLLQNRYTTGLSYTMLSKSPQKQCRQQQAATQAVYLPISARLFTRNAQMTMLQQSELRTCAEQVAVVTAQAGSFSSSFRWLLQNAKLYCSLAFCCQAY